MKVTGTKYFVNGVVQPGLIQPPHPSRVAHRVQIYGEELTKLELIKANTEERLGSKFFGYAVWARTLRTIDMAYLKIRVLHPYARHIMMAFSAAGEKGSCDDGEYFGDLALVKEIDHSNLSNIALFVARQTGDRQLGAQRFEAIRLVAQELVMKLHNDQQQSAWEDLPQSGPSQAPETDWMETQEGRDFQTDDDWADQTELKETW